MLYHGSGLPKKFVKNWCRSSWINNFMLAIFVINYFKQTKKLFQHWLFFFFFLTNLLPLCCHCRESCGEGMRQNPQISSSWDSSLNLDTSQLWFPLFFSSTWLPSLATLFWSSSFGWIPGSIPPCTSCSVSSP